MNNRAYIQFQMSSILQKEYLTELLQSRLFDPDQEPLENLCIVAHQFCSNLQVNKSTLFMLSRAIFQSQIFIHCTSYEQRNAANTHVISARDSVSAISTDEEFDLEE